MAEGREKPSGKRPKGERSDTEYDRMERLMRGLLKVRKEAIREDKRKGR